MNGLQIAHFLSMDVFTAKYFKGFIAVDSVHLPYAGEDPALYILNTDVEKGVGEHWCAVLFFKGRMEFFDPFGMPPSFYGFENILSSNGSKYCYYNAVCVQSVVSKVCGPHCLFYAYHRCRDVSLQDILKMYNPGDVVGNDKKVLNFVCQFGSVFAVCK